MFKIPRVARKKSTNGIYHIMLRGINRQTIFEDDEDKFKFLATIKKYQPVSRFSLYGYCLMDNHVHLLIKESEETISLVIKRISSSYVYWYNMKYERCGHLFQDRFKSENVENVRYFLTVLRYIHQNPLKAGLASNVFESKWTSINEYVLQATIVDVHFPLQLFSPNRKIAIAKFKDYMNKPNEDECLDNIIKIRVSDDEIRKYLCDLGITNISTLQHMKKDVRDCILAELKGLKGISIRQLARVTGISKSVIQRSR